MDNERMRVTEWRFAPGAATGWHRHDYDYVVIPLNTGQLRISNGEGDDMIANLTMGIPYGREVGVEHDVINANPFEFAFMEVEYKPAANTAS